MQSDVVDSSCRTGFIYMRKLINHWVSIRNGAPYGVAYGVRTVSHLGIAGESVTIAIDSRVENGIKGFSLR